MSQRNLMVGIGSSHGCDQIGWWVATSIKQRSPSDCDVRLALAPADLLDWIAKYPRVHICDACSGNATEPTVHRWLWPNAQIEQLAWGGTHDLSLPGILQLATTLGMASAEIVIWGIEVPNRSCGESHSAEIEQVVSRVAQEITQELQRAADRCAHA